MVEPELAEGIMYLTYLWEGLGIPLGAELAKCWSQYKMSAKGWQT